MPQPKHRVAADKLANAIFTDGKVFTIEQAYNNHNDKKWSCKRQRYGCATSGCIICNGLE